MLCLSVFELHSRWVPLTLSSNRIRGPTRFRKALKAFFAKHVWLRSRNDSYSQFLRSPQGTPGTMTPLLCNKYEGKRVADYEFRCLRKRD